MLHGNPTWGFLYRKVAAALVGTPVRLVMPDLLGLGFSDKPEASAHRLEVHAKVIRALIDALGLTRFVFVGQDWGGAIGGCAIAERPEQLAGAVVLNTALGPPKASFRPTAFHRLARVPVASELVFRLGHFPQRGMWLAQGDKLSLRGAVARAYRYPLRGLRQNVAPLAMARMVPDSFDHPSIPALRRCEAFFSSYRGPAAIVWGDCDPVLGRLRGRIERTVASGRGDPDIGRAFSAGGGAGGDCRGDPQGRGGGGLILAS